jgi:squalene cyclase
MPKDTEDAVFRLRALKETGADDALPAATADVLSRQRPDGGWPQTPDAASDPYATATTLAALHDAGMPATDSTYQRGVRFLVGGQERDGSWHTPTRAKPVQIYFESGFPHGKDQFISMAATSWAILALVLASR